jgi:two-component sensor histidine kinase
MEVSEYLAKLHGILAPSLGYLRPVSLTIAADRHVLPPQQALAIGLIVNEFATNAYKYAFPDDRPGAVAVTFRKKNGRCELVVADNGIGSGSQPGMGTRLVDILAAQVGGTIRWEAPEIGTKVVVTLPY